ncbi:hypothetical protein D9611_006601 [Ephemerocybe angulata]|uniref:RRM domain-containing protein n=1 Tax=Ephemerocybe angulata TaxID=980116 RepID=A0A8H5C949_9AGAR|nr:hypothetical protein D9611_006601 [Tulosesus angulatus]
MNTPPRSPSPLALSSKASSTTKVMHTPAKQDMPTVDATATASSPHALAHVGPGQVTTLPSHADDATARVDGTSSIGVDSEEALDAEVASANSSSSEEVEIYLNDLGMSDAVGSGASGKVFGLQSTVRGRVIADSFSSQATVAAPATLAPPLLTPTRRDTEASTDTHTVTRGAASSTHINSTTSDTTIDAGHTTTTTTIDTNSGLPSTPSRRAPPLDSLELRSQLLSPVGDLVDSPIIPPVTRMSTIPLPDMYDHDDPTTLLPRSMEQMDIREAQTALRRSPKEKTRMRGLTVGGGGSALTPPPSSPLPPLPTGAPPSTAPPHLTSFSQTTTGFGQQQQFLESTTTSGAGRNGSVPSTPPIGMQPTTNYTQSQPLPQLPTFAPGLSVIDEGTAVSKDDLHLDAKGGGAAEYENGYGREGDEFQQNMAEANQQQQRQNANVTTIQPVYQQYGTITVSNSVVSFPNSGSNAPLPTSGDSNGISTSTSATSFPGQQKTPNVYINGLPPHFPEEQLEALATPFGEVKSVRTFTRHVRDSESGYGFVLFETVEAAEKCIIALRKCRNLHPTFSKQIHKIPGTVYAQANTSQGSNTSLSNLHQWDSNASEDDGDTSFKARMEALADPTSTNLYMEGLPLSTNDRTRLSNPPRIIAFVRLETRVGAEEVIERYHGKIVPGPDDAGGRISVRFADTSEQRELRRQERTIKEGGSTGEVSPGQLTIAQAALLNLRGQDLRGGTSPYPNSAGTPITTSLPSVTSTLAIKPAPIIGFSNRGGLDWAAHDAAARIPTGVSGVSGREIIGSSREYAVNSALSAVSGHGLALGGTGMIAGGGGTAGRIARLGNGAPGIDYGSAFAGSPIGTIGSQQLQRQRQYQALDGNGDGMSGMGIQNPFQTDFAPAQRDFDSMGQYGGGLAGMDGTMDPTMKALLESLGGGGVDQQQQQEFYRMQMERSTPSSYGHLHQQSNASQLQYPTYGGSGVASTHTGYTPAEEYIMRAHAENAARQRDYGGSNSDVRASLLQQQHQAAARKRPSPLDLGRHAAGRRQDEGGVDIGIGVRGYRMQASLVGMSDEEVFHAQAQAEREAEQQQMDSAGMDQQDHEHGHHMHARATTLPHQQQQHQQARRRNSILTGPQSASVIVGGPSASARGQSRHHQHSSMSISSTTALRTPQHASAPTMGGQMEQQQQQGGGQTRLTLTGDGRSGRPTLTWRSSYGQGQQQQIAVSQAQYDDLSHSPTSTLSSDSPSLISPALTYSSQHTPSTLSPATPFFGSFNSQSDGFRGAGVVERKDQGDGVNVKGHALRERLA